MGGLEETLRAFLRPDLEMVIGGLIGSCCFYSALDYRESQSCCGYMCAARFVRHLNKLSSDPIGLCEPIFINISRASFDKSSQPHSYRHVVEVM